MIPLAALPVTWLFWTTVLNDPPKTRMPSPRRVNGLRKPLLWTALLRIVLFGENANRAIPSSPLPVTRLLLMTLNSARRSMRMPSESLMVSL